MVESPLERFLAVIETTTGKRPRRSGDGWLAHCPAHRDRSPSLSIGEGDGARVLVKCHAGCTLAAIVAAVGMTERDLFPDQANGHRDPNEPDAVYDYVDEYGTLLFQVVRLPGKKFRQRRPDGAGGWVWKLGDTRRALYRSDRIFEAIETDTGATVWNPEGEKDVLSLEQLGFLATTCPGGACKWRPEYSEQLRGAAKVVILPDADQPGRKHAAQVAESLIAADIPDVRILDLHPDRNDGADVSDWLARARTDAERDQARALLEQLADQAPPPTADKPPADQPADSWSPRNLALLGDRPQVRPTLGGIGLVYPGKRHAFTGPQESAKTLAAYSAILGVVRDDGTVVLIDLEMGEYDARDRLRDMGAADHDLARIHYVEPDTEPTADAISRLVNLRPELVVIDAAAGAYSLTGLDDNKRADVELWTGIWVKPFWRASIATLVIDHVTKNADGRGKYAIGSERKVGGIDVHLGFETILELNRGGRGLYKITTHKDRPAHLPRPTAAELDIRSDPNTHALTWTFRPHDDDTEHTDGWQPTRLMERVSRYLEIQAGPVSQRDIERDVSGKGKYLREAVQHLLRDAYATETPGPRGARLLTSTRAFRESDCVPTASRQEPPTASQRVP